VSAPISPSAPPAPPFTVAAMGAWLPYYFFEDVIAVLENIAAKNPSQKFALIIASALFNLDLDYKRAICAKITEINATPNNLHVSYRENVEDSLAFLSEADLLVRSSGVDSFGMCVAEALFLGKPAIATNVCRRVNGTRLYEPRDLKQLEAHVAEVYAHARAGTLEKIVLDPAEDAFPLLRKLYQKEAAVA
jgi:glycosyltransferase involved in cell wall biosynthesis